MNSNIKNSIATKTIVAGINFLLVILSVRFLGASGRGEISFFITLLATVQLFSDVVNGPTIVYLSTRLPIKNQLFISFLWSLLISVLAYFIGELLELKDSLLLAACSLQFSMASTCLMLLQGNHKIKLYNFISVLQSVILLALFLFLIINVKREYHSFIYAFLFSWNISFLISIFFILKTLTKNQPSENISETFKRMFVKGIESQSGNFISFFNYRLVFYILAFIDPGKTSLGIVSTAFALVESVLIISNGLSAIQYPAIAKKDNREEAKTITLEYLILCFWLSLAALIVLNLIPAELYTHIFGKNFDSIKLLLFILSPGILFLNIQNTICQYFNGLGLYIINTIGSFIGLASLVLFLIIGYSFGINGLCLSVSASYIVLCLYMFYRLIKHSKVSFEEIILYVKKSKSILAKTLFSNFQTD